MISIITPVYNGERFIDSCIRVVIDQACLDFEHIIIDGGSTDRTVEIIKQYGEILTHPVDFRKDKSIRCDEQGNRNR